MATEQSDCIYSKQDLNKAFSMGLECGALVLENSIGLPCEAQRRMLEFLKKKITDDKIASAMSNKKINVLLTKPANKNGIMFCKK